MVAFVQIHPAYAFCIDLFMNMWKLLLSHFYIVAWLMDIFLTKCPHPLEMTIAEKNSPGFKPYLFFLRKCILLLWVLHLRITSVSVVFYNGQLHGVHTIYPIVVTASGPLPIMAPLPKWLSIGSLCDSKSRVQAGGTNQPANPTGQTDTETTTIWDRMPFFTPPFYEKKKEEEVILQICLFSFSLFLPNRKMENGQA